ncbi:MAG: hypothetical protein II622_00390 [Thermoguttaceae bacterium]|nr:hypothetical protein [Thermoguttaceae bacterium]
MGYSATVELRVLDVDEKFMEGYGSASDVDLFLSHRLVDVCAINKRSRRAGA